MFVNILLTFVNQNDCIEEFLGGHPPFSHHPLLEMQTREEMRFHLDHVFESGLVDNETGLFIALRRRSPALFGECN